MSRYEPKGKQSAKSERYKRLKEELSKRKGVHDPAALAAYIARKKKKKRFQKLAEMGKKR